MATALVNGARLVYRARGKGEPLVLVHGSASDLRTWDGHSYGAFVALLLAMREPRLVRSLVLCEPPAITLFVSNDPRPAEIASLAFRKPRTASALVRFGAHGIAPARAAARKGDMEAVTEALGKAVLGTEFYERLSPERLEQARANTFCAELLGSGFPPIDQKALRALTVPTLLVGGSRSPHRARGQPARLRRRGDGIPGGNLGAG